VVRCSLYVVYLEMVGGFLHNDVVLGEGFRKERREEGLRIRANEMGEN